jgi:hypothetical protein
MAKKGMGTAETARQVPCPEGTLRRLHRLGVVKPIRDPWGRRLFGPDDVEAARQFLNSKRGPRNAVA